MQPPQATLDELAKSIEQETFDAMREGYTSAPFEVLVRVRASMSCFRIVTS